MITLLALASFQLASNAVSHATTGTDAQAARALARGAIEIGVEKLASTNDWRKSLGAGAWVNELPLGPGTITVTAIDPADNDAQSNPEDPLIIRGTGVVNDARQHVEVKLIPVPTPTAQATSSLLIRGTLMLNNAEFVADDPVRIRSHLAVIDTTGAADFQVAGVTLGTIPPGATLQPLARKPEVVTDFSPYTAQAQAQPLPAKTLTGLTLGPGAASHGLTPDPEGDYLLTASGNVTLRGLVLKGTLVIVGAQTVILDRSYYAEPARVGWPTILTDAWLLLAPTREEFPSPGATAGWFDDIENTLPVKINGSLTVKNNFIADGRASPVSVRGTIVVSSSVNLTGDVRVTHNPDDDAIPPPTATDYSTLAIVEGSWRRWVD
ncbi:MAG: hypothetical protein AAF108_07415 [Planctomycetota bacterium]